MDIVLIYVRRMYYLDSINTVFYSLLYIQAHNCANINRENKTRHEG